jgi:serine/threonine-protein kinase HipA
MRQESLFIYRSEAYLGKLDIPTDDDYTFTYAKEYLEQGQKPLSLILPLQREPIKGQAVFNFFDGLLPEGRERETLAQYLRIPYQDTGALLASLCGECIGDLVILTNDMHRTGYKAIDSGYRKLDADELNAIIRPRSSTLYATDISSRISLAGAQAKISLYHEGDSGRFLANEQWSLPYGLAASTHILKPQSQDFSALAENEAFCMKLAEHCAIDVAATSLAVFDEPALIVRRFDRVRDTPGRVVRLHQEDICQILGLAPQFKYQSNGGPGLRELGEVIERWSSHGIEDLRRLIDIVAFNYLIGNCDAHGKNFSLVEAPAGGLRLAPAYDLVSTTYYDKVSREMAMSIGGHYSLDDISAQDLLLFSEQLGVDARLVSERFRAIAGAIERQAAVVAQILVDDDFDAVTAIAKHVVQEAQSRTARIFG